MRCGGVFPLNPPRHVCNDSYAPTSLLFRRLAPVNSFSVAFLPAITLNVPARLSSLQLRSLPSSYWDSFSLPLLHHPLHIKDPRTSYPTTLYRPPSFNMTNKAIVSRTNITIFEHQKILSRSRASPLGSLLYFLECMCPNLYHPTSTLKEMH